MVVVSASFSEPVTDVLIQVPSTKLFINDQEIGTAALYITKNDVIWGGGIGDNGALPTITLYYYDISLHAIQREPTPALYMVLSYELRLPGLTPQAGDAGDDDDEFDVDDQPITQLRFIPEDEGVLQQMFTAMNEGQALHPDPQEFDHDDPFCDGEDYLEGDEEFLDAEESNDVGVPTDRLRFLTIDNTNGVNYQDCEDDEIDEE